ncbi:MAG: hypothetical protein GX591_03525 [Planctomycetes bacterium]|nr:hypothetical protein [Planctomycetota bacterium]
MNARPRQRGAAMVLVLIIMAAGTTIALAYLSSAAMGTAITQGHEDVTRARYVAESGMDHAICLLRETPDAAESLVGRTLGPFTLGDGADAYTLSVTATGIEDEYDIVAQGVSGRSTTSVGARVVLHRTVDEDAPATVLPHGTLFSGWTTLIPGCVRVRGPAHANGNLTVLGRVDQDASATGQVTVFGQVDGTPRSGAAEYPWPSLNPADYENYILDGAEGQAQTVYQSFISRDSDLNGRAHITEANPAGVVIAIPPSGMLEIDEDVSFHGTLIVHGHLVLNGKDERFKAEAQFPALMVTGRIWVTGNTEATIEGVVYAAGGVEGILSDSSSELTIKGALVAGGLGFGLFFDGEHTVRYDAALATLVSPEGGQEGRPTVEVRSWYE